MVGADQMREQLYAAQMDAQRQYQEHALKYSRAEAMSNLVGQAMGSIPLLFGLNCANYRNSIPVMSIFPRSDYSKGFVMDRRLERQRKAIRDKWVNRIAWTAGMAFGGPIVIAALAWVWRLAVLSVLG